MTGAPALKVMQKQTQRKEKEEHKEGNEKNLGKEQISYPQVSNLKGNAF